MVMFDGSHGIHRGGQVGKGGARWAVQIALRVAEPAPKEPLQRRIRWAVKRKLLRARDVVRGLKQMRATT
jgi:hypothetical protein